MKRFCRILSIVVVVGLVITSFIFVIKAINKPRTDEIYAETVQFVTMAGSIELYIDNELVINEDMVKITPSNCTIKPEFTIRGYGESVDEADIITTDKISFNSSGKYVLACKVKSSKEYYIQDTFIVNVVESINLTSSMYIKKINSPILYVEDEINIEEIIEMSYLSLATVDIKCSEHLTVNNNIVTVLNEGVGSLEIYLTCNNVTISATVSYLIKPKLVENEFSLILGFNGNQITNYFIELAYSPFNVLLTYEIPQLDNNQYINCWTDSDNVQVVSVDVPIIILKTLNIGESIVYISPVDYPDVIFEILVTII